MHVKSMSGRQVLVVVGRKKGRICQRWINEMVKNRSGVLWVSSCCLSTEMFFAVDHGTSPVEGIVRARERCI